jgi:hypothetical protein
MVECATFRLFFGLFGFIAQNGFNYSAIVLTLNGMGVAGDGMDGQ